MNTTKATPALNLPDVSTLPVHDRTGLTALGVLPSGRIVWPVMGGADDDTDDQDGGQDDRNTGGGQGGGSGADQDDDDDDGGSDDDTDDGDDSGDGGDGKDKAGKDKPRRIRDRRARTGDDKTERTIAAIREDFKDERSKRQAAEKATAALQKQMDDMQATQAKQMDALAKALGLKKDDTPPSPEEVAKNLGSKLQAAEAETEAERKRADTAQANYREAATQLAVYLAADDHDANPRALLDSARFLKSVTGLDPDADDFSSKIADAIDQAVEKNERLRKAKPRAAERSGGEMNTGNKPQRKRPASLNEAVKKHYDQAR